MCKMGTRQNVFNVVLSLLVMMHQYQYLTAAFECSVRDLQNYTDSIRECDFSKTITFGVDKWGPIPKDLINKTQSTRGIIVMEYKIKALDNKGFCDWPNLASITANSNNITTLPSNSLAGCRFLQSLSLSRNNISEIYDDAFHGLSALLDLDLSNNKINALSGDVFKPLRLLKTLRLNNNQIGAISNDNFQSNVKLLMLDLSFNRIEVIQKESFYTLNQLSTLDVSCNLQLQDIDLSGMDRLKDASINNASLTSLHVTTNVVRVFAAFNNISKVTIDSNGALEELNLSHNRFQDLQPLTQADKLTILDISDNNITNLELTHFMGIPIHELSVLNNPIKTFNVRDLSDLKELRKIQISFNLLDNQTLFELDNLTRSLKISLLDPNRDQELQVRTNPIVLPSVTPVPTKDISTSTIKSTTVTSTTSSTTPKPLPNPAIDSKDAVIAELLKRIRSLETNLHSNSELHEQMIANVSNLRIMIVCTIIAFSIFVSFQIFMFVSTRYNGLRFNMPNVLSSRVNGVNNHRQRNLHNSMDPIMEEVL